MTKTLGLAPAETLSEALLTWPLSLRQLLAGECRTRLGWDNVPCTDGRPSRVLYCLPCAIRAAMLAVREATLDAVIDASMRSDGNRYAEALKAEIEQLGKEAE